MLKHVEGRLIGGANPASAGWAADNGAEAPEPDFKEPQRCQEHRFLGGGEILKARRVPHKGDVIGLAGTGVETEAWVGSQAVAKAWVWAGSLDVAVAVAWVWAGSLAVAEAWAGSLDVA